MVDHRVRVRAARMPAVLLRCHAAVLTRHRAAPLASPPRCCATVLPRCRGAMLPRQRSGALHVGLMFPTGGRVGKRRTDVRNRAMLRRRRSQVMCGSATGIGVAVHVSGARRGRCTRSTNSPFTSRFFSSKLKDPEVCKRFTNELERASCEKAPQFQALKQKALQRLATPADLTQEANQMVVDIIQHAAGKVLGRVHHPQKPTTNQGHDDHHSSKHAPTRHLQRTEQQARYVTRNALTKGKRHDKGLATEYKNQ